MKSIKSFRKKISLIFAILIFIIISVCVSCAQKNNNSWEKLNLNIDNNSLETVEKNFLNVAISPGFRPWEYTENGALKGFDVDIANMIGDSLGLRINFIQYSFQSLPDELEKGIENDFAISGIVNTDERQKKFNFSNPYYTKDEKLLLIVKADSRINENNIDNVIQEKDIRVCIPSQSSAIYSLQKSYPNIKFVEINTFEEDTKYIYESLDNNKGDIFVVNEDYYKLGGDTHNYHVVKTVDWHEDICIMFSKNKPNLLDAINKVLEARKSEINQLYDKYFKE